MIGIGRWSGYALKVGIALTVLLMTPFWGRAAASGEGATVTMSGNAYAFFGIDNTMPGAVVRIEEYPQLEAAVQPDGSYRLEVPDGVNVTPYIVPADTYDPELISSLRPPPPYERVYNQTFRTSGEDLEKVHFQIPANEIYKVFIRALGAEYTGPPGDERLKNCAIVSTFSMKEARAADDFRPPSPEPPGYPETFRDVYPHGVAGSTGSISPRPASVDGPVFFSFPGIFPDRDLTASTVDGGVLWTEVPPGSYWMEAENPEPGVEFAPFRATCKPGRLVNASPPWGFYELENGTDPDPAVFAEAPDTAVSATVGARASVSGKGRKRTVSLVVNAGEQLKARMTIRRGGRRLASLTRELGEGRTVLRKVIPGQTKAFTATLGVTLTDLSGNVESVSRSVRIKGRST